MAGSPATAASRDQDRRAAAAARNPPPATLAQLVEQLEVDEDRSIVPVRVFWLPAEGGPLSKVAGLLPGWDPYHPSERQQRRILRSDPRRVRVLAGESAKVSELRQQWRDTTVGENPATSPISSPVAPFWRWSGLPIGYWGRSTSRRGW